MPSFKVAAGTETAGAAFTYRGGEFSLQDAFDNNEDGSLDSSTVFTTDDQSLIDALLRLPYIEETEAPAGGVNEIVHDVARKDLAEQQTTPISQVAPDVPAEHSDGEDIDE